MGRHASAERRRSVAAWPIIVGVVVLLLVAATVGYFQLTKRDNDAAACTGTTVLPVVVAPGAAPAVERAAEAFNSTKPEARSTCVSVSVTTVPGPAAVTALAGGWRGQRTPAPGLWIADSAADVAALDASTPAMTAGHPTQGLASSPVVLAVRQAPGGAPGSWTSLAAGSGGLVLGIGDPAADRAAAAALQSLVRGASRTPTAGTAIDTTAVATAAPALARLAVGSSTVPASTDAALTDLAGGQSRYTAVPVLESALATFNTANGASLTALYPTGPTAAATLLPIPLTATWVTNAMSDAAAAFDGYLGDAAGSKILTAAHLRTSAAPVAAAGVDLRTPVTVLADAGGNVSTALIAAWKAAGSGASAVATAPSVTAGSTGTAAGATAQSQVSGSSTPTATPATARTTSALTNTSVAPTSKAVAAAPAITFLVDTSGSMSTTNNGAQRLTWVKSAISTVVQKSPRSSFGLWSFATSTSEPIPFGPLDGLVNGIPRSTAIVAALNQLTPSGNSYTYRAIATTFADAANDTVPGRVHRVIVLTDGSDSTPGLSRDSIKATVAGLVAQHRGLTLDIIGLSTSVNELALTEIAGAGGGTFKSVDNLADLEPALLALTS